MDCQPGSRFSARVWWQWTTRPRLVMTDITKTGAGSLAAPPASRAKGKRYRRGGMASAGLDVAHQLGHGSWPTPETQGHGMDEPGQAAMLTAVDAILAGSQRPASGASGRDRIVGVMSGSGSQDSLPPNCGRGATMGPPVCSGQSSPVVFCGRCCHGLQGLSSSWDDWRGQKVFLIRKRSQVRVLDRPLRDLQAFPGALGRPSGAAP